MTTTLIDIGIRLGIGVLAIIGTFIIALVVLNVWWSLNFLSLKGLTPEELAEYWGQKRKIKNAKAALRHEKYVLWVLKSRLRRAKERRIQYIKDTKKSEKKYKGGAKDEGIKG